MPDYATHHASVVVNAPVSQVYAMFSHFNDFPKFMSFVKEVTYYDNQRSHWVAEVAGRHEWDAVNDNWVPDQQIGWRSTNGIENFGKVTFQPTNANQTQVDVFINYNPPAGVLGDLGENLGVGNRFDNALQNDLNHFAKMVDQAPAGALDPNASNYLFHEDSAAAKGTTTNRQNETMQNDMTTGYGNSSNSGYNSNPDTGYNSGQNTNVNAGYDNTAIYGGDGSPNDRPLLDRDITGTTNRELNNEYGNRDSNISSGVPAENLPPTGNRDLPGY